MLAEINWQSISLATAFVLGQVMGVVVTVRLFRVVSNVLHQERQRKIEEGE